MAEHTKARNIITNGRGLGRTVRCVRRLKQFLSSFDFICYGKLNFFFKLVTFIFFADCVIHTSLKLEPVPASTNPLSPRDFHTFGSPTKNSYSHGWKFCFFMNITFVPLCVTGGRSRWLPKRLSDLPLSTTQRKQVMNIQYAPRYRP